MNYSQFAHELNQWADLIDKTKQQRLQLVILDSQMFRKAADALTNLVAEVDRLLFEQNLLFEQIQQRSSLPEPSELLRRRAEIDWNVFGVKP